MDNEIRTVKALAVLVPLPPSLYKKVKALNKLPTIRRSMTIIKILTSIFVYLIVDFELCDPNFDYANI